MSVAGGVPWHERANRMRLSLRLRRLREINFRRIQTLIYGGFLLCGATPSLGSTMPPPTSEAALACASPQGLAVLPGGQRIPCESWSLIGTPVAGYAWKAPHARAVMLIQHGYGDYAMRYVGGNARLIPYLLAHGISVYAFDMRGNGFSPGKRGVVDVEQAIQDHLLARSELREQALPVFVLGHSLGGLVAITGALRNQTDIAGIVLLAPAIKYKVAAPLRLFVSAGAALFPAAALPGSKADVNALVADVSTAAALQADPTFYPGPLRFLTAAGGLRQSRKNWIGYPALRVPLLAVHGTADTSTDPAGSHELVEVAGSSDKTMLVVANGRHALLDDTDRDQTRDAILSWIDARITTTAASSGP